MSVNANVMLFSWRIQAILFSAEAEDSVILTGEINQKSRPNSLLSYNSINQEKYT